MAIRTWNGLGWKATMGLWNLEIKGLVELDSKNRLRMHDHLPDLGRDIANKKKNVT